MRVLDSEPTTLCDTMHVKKSNGHRFGTSPNAGGARFPTKNDQGSFFILDLLRFCFHARRRHTMSMRFIMKRRLPVAAPLRCGSS